MIFRNRQTVQFGQVDAAGIIFYPRYFEMINAVLESWFAEGLQYPFNVMIGRDGCGIPVVDIRAKFLKASRLGDELTFNLTVSELQRTSVQLAVDCECAGEQRLTALVSHIFVQLQPLKAKTIPEWLRTAMLKYRN